MPQPCLIFGSIRHDKHMTGCLDHDPLPIKADLKTKLPRDLEIYSILVVVFVEVAPVLFVCVDTNIDIDNSFVKEVENRF